MKHRKLKKDMKEEKGFRKRKQFFDGICGALGLKVSDLFPAEGGGIHLPQKPIFKKNMAVFIY